MTTELQEFAKNSDQNFCQKSRWLQLISMALIMVLDLKMSQFQKKSNVLSEKVDGSRILQEFLSEFLSEQQLIFMTLIKVLKMS